MPLAEMGLSISGLSLTRQADIVGRLWLNRGSWVVRRHDLTTLVDPRRVQWETRFEFVLPRFEPELEDTEAIPVPLIYARKNPLITVDVLNGAGLSLHTLTWDERRRVLERLLVDTARGAVAPEVLAPSIELLLGQLVADETESRDAFNLLVALGKASLWPSAELSRELRSLVEAGRPGAAEPWSQAEKEQAAVLFDNPVLGLLMPEFRQSNLLLGVLPYEPGLRHIVEIRHDTLIGQVTIDRNGAQRDVDAIVLPVSSARSYHAVIQVPEGLVFAQPVRVGSIGLPLPPGTAGASTDEAFVEHDLPVQCGVGPPGDGWRSTVFGRSMELHVVTSERRAAVAIMARDGLRSEGSGVSQVAFPLVTITMVAMLGGVGLHLMGVAPTADSSSTGLLLALVSAFAGYLLQRPSSPVERRVARGPRRVILGALLISAAAAVTLTLDFPEAHLPGFALALRWGWRAVGWLVPAAASLCLWIFTLQARRRW